MNLTMRPVPTRQLALRGALALALLAPSPAIAAPGLAPVPEDRSGGDAARPVSACPAAQEAMASGRASKYSEAGRQFEACARSSGDASLWKKAGMARYSAKQYAHTIEALDAYLRVHGGDAQVEAMLEDARKNSTTVRFSVVTAAGAATPERLRVRPRGGVEGDEIDLPWSRSAVSVDVWLDPGQWSAELALPGGGRVGPQDIQAARDASGPQVVLFRVEAAAAVPTPPATAGTTTGDVELSLGPGAALRRGVELTWSGPETRPPQVVRKPTSRWPLAVGRWQVQAKAKRFEPQTRDVEVGPGEPGRVRLELKRTREDRARIGVAAGLGGVSLVLLATGVALVARGGKDYRAATDGIDGTRTPASLAASDAAIESIRGSSNGMLLATSAAGAGAAAITVAADGSSELLAVEAGVGGALLIAGIAWLVPAKKQYAADASDTPGWAPDRTYFDEHRRPELAAAGLLGLGAGLAAGAGVALITRAVLGGRKSRRAATLGPITAPRAVGLALRGTF